MSTYKKQLFAAPDNMTGSSQIRVKAREIDFVTSFAKNTQHLLDILGISRLIVKGNGTELKVKRAIGTLQSGSVAEGDEIPRSQFKVMEQSLGKISIEKYRKSVSIEAIADKGYAAAVQDTDDEFRTELQDKVSVKFYNALKNAGLYGDKTTFQGAIANAIGLCKDKFKKMHKTATGVAVWVNTLDLYDYLGSASITVQSAFGFDYVENFLGADVVFISSEIDRGVVYATPKNNIIGYYVSPSDSEFAQAGLAYTSDAATGMIGFHVEGDYNRALSDSFAIMGIRIMCEYIDAVAAVYINAAGPSLELDVNINAATDLLGKVVGDLQSGVSVADGVFKGTLKFVTGYSGFSGDPEEQFGNFLACHATATAGSTITVELLGGKHEGTPKALDADGLVVCQLKNVYTQALRFVATKDGKSTTKVYSLAGLWTEED